MHETKNIDEGGKARERRRKKNLERRKKLLVFHTYESVKLE